MIECAGYLDEPAIFEILWRRLNWGPLSETKSSGSPKRAKISLSASIVF